MNIYKTTNFIMKNGKNNGEKLSLIINSETLVPDDFLNEYFLIKRRKSISSSTLQKEVLCICSFYNYCYTNGFDIKGFIKNKSFFGTKEIFGHIFNFITYDSGGNKVTNNVFNYKLDVIKSFLEYHYNNTILESKKYIELNSKKENMIKQISSLRKPKNKNKKRVGYSKEEIVDILNKASPNFENNCWNREQRLRNYIIFLIMFNTGVRRGELLKLYVRDIITYGNTPTISIVRKPNDKYDTRKLEPNVKTQERQIPISKNIATEIHNYIMKERDSIFMSRKTPYLFLNTRTGKPLSLRGLNKIFDQFRLSFPEYKLLTPHICRHSFNELILSNAQEDNLSNADFVRLSKYLNGWLGDNTSTYTQKTTELEVNRLLGRLQEGL